MGTSEPATMLHLKGHSSYSSVHYYWQAWLWTIFSKCCSLFCFVFLYFKSLIFSSRNHVKILTLSGPNKYMYCPDQPYGPQLICNWRYFETTFSVSESNNSLCFQQNLVNILYEDQASVVEKREVKKLDCSFLSSTHQMCDTVYVTCPFWI